MECGNRRINACCVLLSLLCWRLDHNAMLSHAPHHKVSKAVLPWRSNLFLSGAVTTMHNIVKGPAYKRYVTL